MSDTDDLHSYDGHERRFGHDDAEPEQRERGRRLVMRLLQLPEPPPEEGLRYTLSFYSGGIGVLDRLHVAMACTPTEVEAIVLRLGMLSTAPRKFVAKGGVGVRVAKEEQVR